MSEHKYIKKRDLADAKRSTWRASSHDVIYDRVMTKTGYGMFSEQRPLEEQVKQCVEVISELCDHLGIDASIFNNDYKKVEQNDDETDR